MSPKTRVATGGFAGGLACVLACALGCALLSGCVRRVMVIESDPPGARCYIDNRYAGETPVEIPFTFYGTREIVLRRDKYRSHRVMESMNPPWYGYIPFDFFVENLWPGEVIDRREFSYMLEPFALPGGEERDEMLEELRRRAEDLRTEEEKPENDEPSGAGEAEQENSRKAEQ